MNFELEAKLNNKVEKWEFHALQQEVNRLERKNGELQLRIERFESKLLNYYSAFEVLQRVLVESEQIEETEELHTLLNYL